MTALLSTTVETGTTTHQPQLGLYSNHRSTQPERFITMQELAGMALEPRTGAKGVAPLVVPHDGPGKTLEAAQTALFAAVVIDHDNDNRTAEGMRKLYEGLDVPYLAFTTSSHSTAAPRWKVVVPFARPVEAEIAAQLSTGIAHSLGADTAQARLQQGFYAPNKLTPESDYLHINELAGKWLQPDDGESAFVMQALRGWEDYQKSQESQAQAAPAKSRAVADSTGTIIEQILQAHDLAELLERHGYTRKGKDLYLSPWSSSGMAGVRLLERDGKQVVYSHHGTTDPLSAENHNGHALDTADVLAELEHGGDFNAMIRAEAERLDPEGQKQRQREHMQEKERQRSTANHSLFDSAPPYNLFGTFALPDLPMNLIPQAIGAYSEDQGELIGADPAAMVLFCLGVAGACIDERLKIQPKRHDPTWTESARLWCGVIGDPSVKKSPLLHKALAPAFAINGKWRKAANKAMAKWQEDCKNTPEGEEKPPKPIGKRLLVNDATVEKLSDILSKHEPRGMLSYQDELSGWLASMDAYKNGTGGKDKGAWLEAFNGGTKFFDRVTRGELYVENWGISVLGGIQPTVIQSYAQTTNHDGMLQRFILLYAQQPTALGQDRMPREGAKESYRALIEHLAELEPSGAPVTLSEGAHRHREALEGRVHNLLRNHPNQHLAAALGKWSGLFARLLLVWHCCESHSQSKYPNSYQVTEGTAEKVAAFMWQILLPHLLKFYGAIDPLEDSSQDLARLILAKGWERFTVKRDFNQHWKASRRMKPWEIAQTLERLEGFNWIAPDPAARVNKDGSPTAFLVNPEVHVLHAEQARAERERRQEVAAAMAELGASHAV